MNSKNTTLWILAFIMVVNALSYGVVIPLLYPYAAKFGLTAFGMSLIFAAYSLAQFVATPILGRWSDKYGRKPLLLICLAGTAASLALFAVAKTILVLFLARMLDGITGGNVSVAQAVISDSVEPKKRARAFGILGAAFGFGILFGPAIGGLLSAYEMTVPFWFSAGLALMAVVFGFFFLPETLDPNLKDINNHEPLFKVDAIYKALFTPFTGVVLVASFLAACSLNAMIIGFQAFSVDVLRLQSKEIGIFFSSFGLVGILMQAVGINLVLKRFHSKKKVLAASLSLSAVTMFAAFLSRSLWPFFISMILFGVVSAFRDPMINSLLTERTNDEDQGGILGINQAYVSLGQIVGPLTAGLVTKFSISSVFLVSTGFLILSLVPLKWLRVAHPVKANL